MLGLLEMRILPEQYLVDEYAIIRRVRKDPEPVPVATDNTTENCDKAQLAFPLLANRIF